MAKKKQEEVEETTAEVTETEATEETPNETNAVSADAATEEKPKKAGKKAKAEDAEETEETSVVESVVSADTSAAETVAETVVSDVEKAVAAVTGGDSNEKTVKVSKRAEKVGIVASDKMTNTVTVRVDRLVKHPIYRKYIKRRKKFMAHDILGAKIGDKVRIVETRPLSARKRWRVVEIIQRAER